jgi:hypothetical protein
LESELCRFVADIAALFTNKAQAKRGSALHLADSGAAFAVAPAVIATAKGVIAAPGWA